MIKNKFFALCGMTLLAAAGAHAQLPAPRWNVPTPAPNPTQVQPWLNVEVSKDTEEVNFVNTNNDPFVFTKVYVLKHADPYEIRPYVMAAIRSRRIDTNVTKVEAIKYMDGTGMLIVSAEEYRFTDYKKGMSIDKIIESLDRPGLSSSAGRQFFLYYPKYWDSVTLSAIVRRVGLVQEGDEVELQGGIDTVRADTGLNAMFFYAAPNSVKTIQSILNDYDGPTSEAIVKYSIYEIEYENDGSIGVDFQAWKNGPGADLFAAGARYSNGWDFANNNVATNVIKKSHTDFINFNPKWNSKYLDFLVAKSKAKVMTTGSLSIMNKVQGSISCVTRMPIIEDGAAITSNTTLNEYQRITWQPNTAVYPYNTLVASNVKGGAINMPANYTGEMVVTRSKVNGNYYYTMELDKSGAVFTDATTGKSLGRVATAYGVVINSNTISDVSTIGAGATTTITTPIEDWLTDQSYTIQKDKKRDTKITEFGFVLQLTPEVYENASIVKVHMENTNLIGFKSNGEPRTSRTQLDTKLQMGNTGKMFYIGGLDKKAVTRSVNKVPYLGDIPGLGWIFSGESEVVKKTQLVAVLEVRPVTPDTAVGKDLKDIAAKTVKKIDGFGIKGKYVDENEYGFDQYLLDPDKGKE